MKWHIWIYASILIISLPLYYLMIQNEKNLLILTINFFIGIYLLVKGSDYFIDGAASVATHIHVSEHTIGLTLVALATSLPELAVSDIASFTHHPSTAWGNVVGSNIANIGLVLGIAAIIMPLKLSSYIRRDAITLGGVTTILLFFAILFHSFVWWMGILFLLIYGIYINEIRGRKMEGEEVEIEKSYLISIILVIWGGFGIVWGADLLVRSAVNIAIVLNVPEIFIAVTAVALGTSLPELATTVTATLKKKHGIAVGNIIGSNIFNILVVLGTAAMINPVNISSHQLNNLFLTLIFLGIVTYSLFVFCFKNKIGKYEGIFFLLIYALFIIFFVI